MASARGASCVRGDTALIVVSAVSRDQPCAPVHNLAEASYMHS
jgi:hypothetical protein